MVVLPSTGVTRYQNCCIDGGTCPEYFGYPHSQYITTSKLTNSSSVFKRKFQPPGNNSVCEVPFHFLRGHVVEREYCGNTDLIGK
jgi:hypothetical protein